MYVIMEASEAQKPEKRSHLDYKYNIGFYKVTR
jgi:hypothetical protein